MADSHRDNEQLVVVRQRRGERLWHFTTLLVFSVGAGVGGFVMGGYHYETRYESVREGLERTREERNSLQEEVAGYREERIRLRREAKVDNHSLSQTREAIRELEEQLKARESEITFYKTIMAPGDLEEGLQVHRLDLDATRDDNRWRYNLVLSQIGDNNRFISGRVNVQLIGYVDGERRTLPLEAISASREGSDIKFRFRYFQTVDGHMTIPEDFRPDAVQVMAVSDRGNQRSERVFRWQDKTGDEANVSQGQAGP